MEKILFRKLKMTQLWKGEKVIPVTVLGYAGTRADEEFSKLNSIAKVAVSGVSKGKGFQGVVKRHGFHGGPKTHGQKNRLRAPGSIGPTAPQRTLKGRKMAGHMGSKKVTVKYLRVVEINPEARTLSLCGAVPGARGSRIEVRI